MGANRESFLRSISSQRRYREVNLPQQGVSVRIQSLTERDRSRYELFSTAADGRYDRILNMSARRFLIALCLVDDDGKRLMGDSDEELIQLADMDAGDAGILFDACRKHCGLDAEEAPGESMPLGASGGACCTGSRPCAGNGTSIAKAD
jgi:hypothetical protein